MKGDTPFNESFATAVERLGVARWLDREGGEAARQAYDAGEQRRQAFRALKRQARAALAQVYAQAELPQEERLARKAQVLAELRADWLQLRASWGGDPGRFAANDRWVEEANNASLGAEAAYDTWVPAFEALFAREAQRAGREDWPGFYRAVQRLAALPADARRRALEDLAERPARAGSEGRS